MTEENPQPTGRTLGPGVTEAGLEEPTPDRGLNHGPPLRHVSLGTGWTPVRPSWLSAGSNDTAPASCAPQTLLPHRQSRAFSSLPESVTLTVAGGGSNGLSKRPGQTALPSCQGPIWSWTGSRGPSRVCALAELSPRNVLGPRPALQNGPNAEIHLPPAFSLLPASLILPLAGRTQNCRRHENWETR